MAGKLHHLHLPFGDAVAPHIGGDKTPPVHLGRQFVDAAIGIVKLLIGMGQGLAYQFDRPRAVGPVGRRKAGGPRHHAVKPRDVRRGADMDVRAMPDRSSASGLKVRCPVLLRRRQQALAVCCARVNAGNQPPVHVPISGDPHHKNLGCLQGQRTQIVPVQRTVQGQLRRGNRAVDGNVPATGFFAQHAAASLPPRQGSKPPEFIKRMNGDVAELALLQASRKAAHGFSRYFIAPYPAKAPNQVAQNRFRLFCPIRLHKASNETN